jgi:glycerophosphoryl diester phosphodiesterase
VAEEARPKRRVLVPVLGLAVAGLTLLRASRRSPRPGAAYLAGAPLLIAHRGGSLLAPENTLLAFERALAWWGADIFELDVQPTADGEVVVFHDATLDRTTDGSGLVAAHTLEEIRQLDAGFRFTPDGVEFPFRGCGIRVPTLAEVLATFPGVRINIEIKDGRAQERVWETIRETGATERVLIASGSTRDRARLAGYPVPVSAGREEITLFLAQLRLPFRPYTPAVDALQVPDVWEGRQVLSPALVEAAHARNIPVHVWTVDDPALMRRYLDWGVDGIVTDRPDLLGRILHQRIGRPLPTGAPEPLPESFLERLLPAPI